MKRKHMKLIKLVIFFFSELLGAVKHFTSLFMTMGKCIKHEDLVSRSSVLVFRSETALFINLIF